MKKHLNFLALFLMTIILLISFITPSRLFSQANDISNRHKEVCFELSCDDGSGMFAVFATVLGALHLYDQGYMGGLKVNLNRGLYYDPEVGSNWWEYFFEPIDLGNHQALEYKSTIDEIIELVSIGHFLPEFRAFELIQRYIRIKPQIQSELKTFIRKNLSSCFIIGIHHRGTDKIAEWPIISFEKSYQTINQVIAQLTDEQRQILKIFVATDDQYFLTYLENLFPSQVIYNHFVRSTDGRSLHGNTDYYSSNYQKGKEALLDCLLLSRCHILIRPTSSCLSLASTFFNPYMPVVSIMGNY